MPWLRARPGKAGCAVLGDLIRRLCLLELPLPAEESVASSSSPCPCSLAFLPEHLEVPPEEVLQSPCCLFRGILQFCCLILDSGAAGGLLLDAPLFPLGLHRGPCSEYKMEALVLAPPSTSWVTGKLVPSLGANILVY